MLPNVGTEEENMRSETQLVLEAARDELMQQVEQAGQQTTEMVTGLHLV